MKRTFLFASFVLTLTSGVYAANAAGDGNEFWPQWRGPLATGVAPLADPPLKWDETNHVKWKVKVPGSGDSTPVVWGDRLFLLTAIPTGKKGGAKASEAAAPNAGGGEGGSGEGRGGGRRGAQSRADVYQVGTLGVDRK